MNVRSFQPEGLYSLNLAVCPAQGAVRRSFSSSNWPHVVRVRLIVRVHVAIVEVDVPSVRRIVRVRTARPIVVRLDAAKSAHFSRPSRVGTTEYRSSVKRYDTLNYYASQNG